MLEFNIESDWIEFILLLTMIISLIISSELKKLHQVAIAFIVFMSSIAGVYWILGAPVLSVFQLTIYAGTTGVILFAALSVFPHDLDEE